MEVDGLVGSLSKLVDKYGSILILLPALVWVFLFLVIPVALLASISFFTPMRGGGYTTTLTFENYLSIFSSPYYLRILLNTLRLCGEIVAICLVLAYPAAYFLVFKVRSDRVRMLLFFSLIVLFFIDWSIRTIAWYPVLSVQGLVSTLAVSWGLIPEPRTFMFSEATLILVWIQSYIVFMMSPIYLSMLKINPNLIDVAQTLGASRAKAFYHVVFKMSLPGIIIGCMFVFIMAIADYATPKLIGGGMVTIGSVVVELTATLFWPTAAALSIIIMAITMAFIYLLLKIVDIRRMLF